MQHCCVTRLSVQTGDTPGLELEVYVTIAGLQGIHDLTEAFSRPDIVTERGRACNNLVTRLQKHKLLLA